jgi:hypothetical protein
MDKFKFRILKTEGKAALVQIVRDGKEKRATLPIDLLAEGSNSEITGEQFDMGIPYGLPFAEILGEVSISPVDLENALHNANVWTLNDLESNLRPALGALTKVCYPVLLTLLQKAKAYHPAEVKPAKKKKTVKEEDHD